MKPLLLTFGLLCGADAASTHVALRTGATEMVLPTQSPWAVDAIVAGEAAAGIGVLSWLDRRQHPKAARAIGWSLVAIRGIAVAHNLQQLHQYAR